MVKDISLDKDLLTPQDAQEAKTAQDLSLKSFRVLLDALETDDPQHAKLVAQALVKKFSVDVQPYFNTDKVEKVELNMSGRDGLSKMFDAMSQQSRSILNAHKEWFNAQYNYGSAKIKLEIGAKFYVQSFDPDLSDVQSRMYRQSGLNDIKKIIEPFVEPLPKAERKGFFAWLFKLG